MIRIGLEKNVKRGFMSSITKRIRKEKMGVLCKMILLELFYAALSPLAFGQVKYDPVVSREFGQCEKLKNAKRAELQKKLYYLNKQGFIEKLRDTKGIKLIRLTPKGIIKALKYKFDYEADNIPHWDKKWRIVVFDVEENRKRDREILRNILLNWGFEPLQKSVYVFPHHCLPEIKLAQEAMNLESEIQYIEANQIISDKKLLAKFRDKRLI